MLHFKCCDDVKYFFSKVAKVNIFPFRSSPGKYAFFKVLMVGVLSQKLQW
jgi:hypothetical protein